MKRTGTLVASVLFLVPLFGLGLYNSFRPEKPTRSDLENRALKLMPEPSFQAMYDSTFFKDVDESFADTFAFRDSFVALSRGMKDLKGFRLSGDVQVFRYAGGNAGELANGTGTEPVRSLEDKAGNSRSLSASAGGESTKAVPTGLAGKTGAEGEKEGRMLVVGNKAIEAFSANPSATAAYARALSAFARSLPRNVKVYVLTAPTQAAFYLPQHYASLSDSEEDSVFGLYEALDPIIRTVDALSALRAHSGEYVYFRSDHHWTALGAYYAYAAFCASAGLEAVNLRAMRTETVRGFLGTTYAATLSAEVRKEPDRIVAYIPRGDAVSTALIEGETVEQALIDLSYASYGNKYRIFLGGDRAFIRIESPLGNGRRLLIVKDSYGNAFVPFLAESFDLTIGIDPRRSASSCRKLIETEGITEVLFLNEVFMTVDTEYLNNLKKTLE